MFNRLKKMWKNFMMLFFGIDKKYKMWSMETMLIHEVKNNDQKAVEKLISKGADLNLADSKGKTALMYAAENSNDKLVEILLARGADPSIVDPNRMRALDYGFRGNNKRVIDLLEGREVLETINSNNPWNNEKNAAEKEEAIKQREDLINRPIMEAKEKDENIIQEQQINLSDLTEGEVKEKVNEKVAEAVEDPWLEKKEEEKVEIVVEDDKKPNLSEINIEDMKEKINKKVAVSYVDPWNQDKKEEKVEEKPIEVVVRKEMTLEDLKKEEIEQAKMKKLEKEMLDNHWK